MTIGCMARYTIKVLFRGQCPQLVKIGGHPVISSVDNKHFSTAVACQPIQSSTPALSMVGRQLDMMYVIVFCWASVVVLRGTIAFYVIWNMNLFMYFGLVPTLPCNTRPELDHFTQHGSMACLAASLAALLPCFQ